MWQIIKNEWGFYRRSRALLGLSVGFVLALVLAVFLGHLQAGADAEARAHAHAHLRGQWESLDRMDPHGAAHYGSYLFKPVGPLGGLDEGVGGVTGNVLRLEAHRQNEIVHSEASQMQTASAFGKLNGSLLLQFVLPLILIFLCYQAVGGERRGGRLRLLILQGATPRALLFGKALAVWGYGVALLSVAVGGQLLLHAQALSADLLHRTVWFYSAYATYYFIVCGLTVVLSACWKQAGLALTAMLGLWVVWTIYLPALLVNAAGDLHELPSRKTFQTAMGEDRAEGLDGHNPRDARRKALEEEVLKEYGVDELSELPINFGGVVMQADEEFGNKVWDKHFGRLREVMEQQRSSYRTFGVVNPFIALQGLSRGSAGSDNLHHQDFLQEAEGYRRGFIKALNDKLAYGVARSGEDKGLADNAWFRSVPDFRYRPLPLTRVWRDYAWDGVVLLAWLVLVGFVVAAGSRRLQVV